VALERQSIEKKDFPIGRRGYDPDTVDAHLRMLADELEELKRSERRRTETLASTASEQVRAIVEAAETSAAEIRRQTEVEANEIRSEATSAARAERERASSEAKEYVGKVSAAISTMLERLEAMDGELSALVESLRTGANRVKTELELLEPNLNEVHEAVAPRATFEPEPKVAASPSAEQEELAASEPEAPVAAVTQSSEVEAPDLGDSDTWEEPLRGSEADTAFAAPAPAGPGNGSTDAEGARLVALNMALNGTPREETDQYLAENFDLADRAALLDEVYASVGG